MAYRLFRCSPLGATRYRLLASFTPTTQPPITTTHRLNSSSAYLDASLATQNLETVYESPTFQPATQIDTFEETWTNPGASQITSTEIRHRQASLLRLTTAWLRQRSTSSAQTQPASPLVLIASNPAQFQAHTSIPVDNCKQNSDFTYFTGLHSGESDQLTTDCLLALYAENPDEPDPTHTHAVLFAPTRTKSEQLWNGPDLSTSSYESDGYLSSIATSIRPLSELVDFVNATVRPSSRRDVFLSKNGLTYRPELVTHLKYFMGGLGRPGSASGSSWNEKWSTAMSGSVASVNVRDATTFIDQLRSVKSPAEARALRRIGRIGARALKRTIEWSREHLEALEASEGGSPFYESYIAAKFECNSRLSGAKRIAFPSVCASGRRSTIIHYGRNDRAVKRADWVLTDVGAEDPDGYCCDISRTWPISRGGGGPSYQLRLQLYEALVGVQRRLMDSIVVRETSLDDLYRSMQVELTKVLLEFGAFEDSIVATADGSSNVSSLTRKICPHHVSHYIGLDIHDTPTLARSKPLQPGMCFSIEPGLYFPSTGNLPVKPEFRGIGLRVEDDLLLDPITEKLVNLTADCPSL